MVTSVTIEKSSIIRLPRQVAKRYRLDRRKSADLHFDRQRRIIGIAPRRKGTLPIRHFKNSSSLAARRFLQDYDVVVEKQHRYRCWWSRELGMLLIDVSKPAPTGRPSKRGPAQ